MDTGTHPGARRGHRHATAGPILGLSRSIAYDLAAATRSRSRCIRAGNRYRVPVAALLAALHIPLEPDPAPTAT